MSKEFIERQFNSKSIQEASTQEDQLSYVLTSKLQDNRIDNKYLDAWAQRKYQTNDYFLNWVSMLFKADNFLSFFKYLRYPLPSTKIIHNRIEPQIRRVFNAEDSDFKYSVTGKDFVDFAEDLNIKHFNDEIFQKLLYKHNSILITDLDPTIPNKPNRFYVCIDNVISILSGEKGISQIAFNGSIIDENGKIINGVVYINNEIYAFYEKSNLDIPLKEIPHDLGYTPAHFISKGKFNGDFVIRESIYTYIREEIEEYNFLKTLQKMTETKGAFPVVTKIEAQVQREGQRGDEGQPDTDRIMGSQQARISSQNENVSSGDFDPGSIHEIPLEAVQSSDGTINMDVVTQYFTYHHVPVDILDYIKERITELEVSIISTVVGDFLESNESSKNEDQIAKSISILENTLNSFGEQLNRIRKLGDTDILNLKYGTEKVKEVFIHYGTDHFLDSQSRLFEDLAKAPNALERKEIISRIGKNRYKNNPDQRVRQLLLYDLMPYIADVDFDKGLKEGIVSEEDKQYQLRFNYWIGIFEAVYGDIVTFFKELDGENSEKLKQINNLILELILTTTKTTVE